MKINGDIKVGDTNTTLSDLIGQSISITRNSDCVYSQDLQLDCIKIGKIVILNIHTIAFSRSIINDEVILSGFPQFNGSAIIFSLYGNNGSKGHTVRLALCGDGKIRSHYTSNDFGDSANLQYGGTLIYMCK